MTDYALAVDLGGTKVEAALVDGAGALVPGSRARRATGRSSSSTDLEAAVIGAVTAARASMPPDGRVIAAGVGSAGPVDLAGGRVSPINLPAWRGYPLAHLVAIGAGVDTDAVVLRLDGQCIVLAEQRLGALRGARTAMGMVVSTGIGGGLVIDGGFAPGASGNAGHIGQTLLGDPETGALATLEEIASGPAIVAWANGRGWAGRDGEELAAAYRARHPIAVAAVERCGTAIGRAVLSAAALVDLEVVAIGGGFAKVTPDLFGIIDRTIRDESPLASIDVVVRPAALGDDAPLLGAASLVSELQPA
ncbi:ROK family protein [Agromyces sp. CFH 90414]|uniref:ROK family protein n=1 Tax=Agromyces agglutinans TaxID=2662258 RepID=A0A6I2F351_9MICO|nr:ROK family protein [Agromyces agglutinans]MRG59965.1 ROK family protein [Agromyces agglutinans]